jgi:hypothetical protein
MQIRSPSAARKRTSPAVGHPLLLLVLYLCAIYAPSAGHGFIKDDFGWIASSSLTSPRDVVRVFASNVGFYRPAVSLTFGLNRLMFGLAPVGYGLTNLALVLLTVVAIRSLAVSVGLSASAATVAAAVWALNFHGINGSLLWISGRTSLLVTLFSVVAVRYWLLGGAARTSLWFLAALLAKEDACMLPVVFVAVDILLRRSTAPGTRYVWILLPLLVYTSLRLASGAFGPTNAPAYYRFSFDPALLARHALTYADRGMTFSLLAMVTGSVLLRQMPELVSMRRLVWFGAVWFVSCQLLTISLPASSSLYSVLPSVGPAIAAAAILGVAIERSTGRDRQRALLGVALLLIGAVPIYVARNQRLADLARVSGAATRDLAALNGRVDPEESIVILDDRTQGATLADAFGTLLPAVRNLYVPRSKAIWLEPPPDDWQAAGLQRPTEPILHVRFHGLRLESDPAR